ncbi:Protein of unknown function [Pseudobutyrivibrio sp. C4]|uniref:glycosyltransferase family 61 protein n=1 Tax=Pseudobutyrivibrio sp. C4 TaxID=1520803 RepID=UPI0008AF00AB|nr:glycosyltransferase family 61 protein [Pseudobutyrivibrio sp. C4]SET12506.1 Protein of unknown function [Pseudobutyrivibrio sp. C4]
MKRKIAIWGGGAYGTFIFEKIQEYRCDEYEIKYIADKNAESLQKKFDIPVVTPQEIISLYRDKKIDGVLVGVTWLPYEREMLKFLHENEIPEITILKDTDFVLSDKLDYVEKNVIQCYPGYSINSIEDAYIKCNVEFNDVTYVYTSDGTIIRDTWNAWGVRTIHKNYPLKFDKSYWDDCEKIEELCMLAGCFQFNYWHVTFEMLDKLFVMVKSGYKGKYLMYETGFNKQLIELFDIEESRIIWIKDGAPSPKYLHVSKLYYVVCDYKDRHLHASVLDKAAEYLIEKSHSCEREFGKRVFFKRIGVRQLLGADKILEDYGFEVVIPEELTLMEQIKCFNGADIVLCPHGAGSSNSLYMKKGSHFIETFSRDYINPLCIQVIQKRNVNYHMLVELEDYNHMEKWDRDRDYKLLPDLLKMTIEQIINNNYV